ncbi:MAG: 16S rRNA (cytosine(1402)-N(4))-methyltransferase RsmH [Candidatus Dadabacteria bacterium]|nr:16S rRNA (cytosine(1402)-N(4))-methyltransferase RsmH [Candidatus Dadabacteria bacterium]
MKNLKRVEKYLQHKDYKPMGNAILEQKAPIHIPVMAEEVVNYLVTRKDGLYVDATLGLGGHTKSILQFTNYQSSIIGLDVDEEAISIASNNLSKYKNNVFLQNSNFSEIDRALLDLEIGEVDGIVADLGMSSFQIDSSERGFSFIRDEHLDMRMDLRLRFTAYDLVNEMSVDEISKVLKVYGEERWSRRIAKRIVQTRKEKPISTSAELAKVVYEAIPNKFHPAKIHPATKTFQAFRIAVNHELDNIEKFIGKSIPFLKSGGRIVVISFHSLEDRLVKNLFRRLSSSCICPPDLPMCGCGKKSELNILTRTPLVPSEAEVVNNPRSRSAKMRVGEKL